MPIKEEDRLREAAERATRDAITELHRRGYDVRGKTSAEIVELIQYGKLKKRFSAAKERRK